MSTTSRMGLSILTGGLAFVGAANAADIIVNGSFEEGATGWTGVFQTYNYSAAYYTGPPVPASENPGALYSWQHRAVVDVNGPAGVAQVTQTTSLTSALAAADIDAGRGQYTFSTWLASYGQPNANPDQPYVTLQFLDGGNAPVGGVTVLDRVTGGFFVGFADGVQVFDSTTHLHAWAKYVRSNSIPQGARAALVGIGRSPNAGLSGSPDTYVDLVQLDVSLVPSAPPTVETTSPSSTNATADAVVTAKIRDGTTQVDASSIRLDLDGITVPHTTSKVGALTTVSYDSPTLFAPLSAHTARLIFSDNGAVVTWATNEFSFSVVRYYNVLLPSPLFFENFESAAEGGLPAGWTQVSYSAVPDASLNLQDLNSASYATWTVMDSTRFNSPMLTYNVHRPTTDYQRVLAFNPLNVVNSSTVSNLAGGKIAFGNSGYRDGSSQVLYLFSPAYDLTGRTNVYLSFHSLWEQNQDSIGAIEYSIDGGTTWLPVAYFLETADVLRDASGAINALASLTNVYTDVPTYIDPMDAQMKGGYYGAFIGVASNEWANLGPYIQGRGDDDPIGFKRVEVFALPRAANQSSVKLRFAHAGADSWYFGLDDVGLYSLVAVAPPLLAGPTPSSLIEAVGNSVTSAVVPTGIGPFTYRWQRNGVDVPGQTNAMLSLSNLQLAAAGNYTVVVGHLGGSITSSVASLSVFQPAPAQVIGQWDFRDFDLKATCGIDLDFADLNMALETSFETTDSLGLPRINGQDVAVVLFPGPTAQPNAGYTMRHGLGGTGGGTNVNQYTLIMDILYPDASANQKRTLLQTEPFNADDADWFIDAGNGLAYGGGSGQGFIRSNTWHRIALAVDLAGPGPHPVVAKFVDGTKVGQQTLPEGLDGRWSLSANPSTPWALLFADNDTDVQRGFVSSIQLREGRLSDAAIAAMGGPSPGKIPGAVCVVVSGGTIRIRWSGEVLESASELIGPWTPVMGAAKPYSVPPPLGPRKFYRSR